LEQSSRGVNAHVSTARPILSEASSTIIKQTNSRRRYLVVILLIVYLLGSHLLGVAQCERAAVASATPKIRLPLRPAVVLR
jgi:hypothetical protein